MHLFWKKRVSLVYEISPYPFRGILISIYQVQIAFGILLSYIVSYPIYLNTTKPEVQSVMWHFFSAIPLIPSLLTIILLKFKFKKRHPFENLGTDVSVDMVKIFNGWCFQFSDRYIDNLEKEGGLMMNQLAMQVNSNFTQRLIYAIYYLGNWL